MVKKLRNHGLDGLKDYTEGIEGYKKTEVGVIPDDWDLKKLGDVGKFKNGINKGKEDFGFGYPFVNLLDIFGHTKLSNVSLLGLVNSSQEERNDYNLIKGDILFVRSSVKPQGVGLTSVVVQDLYNSVYSGFLIRFRDFELLDLGYKEYCFYEEGFRKRLIDSSTVSANTNINQDALKNLQVILPPLAEQKAIAQSLSDVDALIAALERLITKKRNTKQGTMQQLLTGKKRLSGFSGEWEVKKLGELGCPGRPAIKAGPFGSSLKKEFYVEKGYKIYGQEQVIAGDLSIGNYYIDSYLFEKLKSCEIRPNDILISLVGTFGKVIVVPDNIERGIINPRLLRLSLDSNWVYPYFLQYWLVSSATQKLLSETSHGGTMGIINAKVLSVLSILLPLIPEQKAIAQILSDMDAEIEVLEQKRDKYKAIKQGMMQELLTGKTRLISSS